MSLIVDVADEVERVVRTPADDPHTGRQLEAFLGWKKYINSRGQNQGVERGMQMQ